MVFETLIIGITLAVIYVEIMDVYPGGIIVPAYIALYLDEPLCVLVTVFIAFLALFSYRVLSRFLILFGRRRFVTLVFLGAFWAQLWFFFIPKIMSAPLALRAIGWLIPGLLANNLEKQKYIPTLASLLTVAVATYFLVRLLTLIL